MRKSTAVAAVIVAFAATCAPGEVADSSVNGFTVKLAITIKAPPAEVYRRVIHNVGDWWNPQHTYSGNSHNLSIEEKPMGCFCEKLPDGGGVRHLEVVFLAPGKTIRMSGGLGPMQAIAATGSLVIELSAVEGGTKLALSYGVTGYQATGMQSWATAVNFVLNEQFTRLKNYVERGDPAPK